MVIGGGVLVENAELNIGKSGEGRAQTYIEHKQQGIKIDRPIGYML